LLQPCSLFKVKGDPDDDDFEFCMAIDNEASLSLPAPCEGAEE